MTTTNEKIMVSIICTAYNHEGCIADALDSFVMQKTNFPFKVIVNDDKSTDKTADIIKEYEKKYPEIIKPIYQTENQYSKGFKLLGKMLNDIAVGKYIALCEGDDYWLDENKLQKQFDYMEAHEDCSFCFHAAEMVTFDKKRITIMMPYKKNKVCSLEDCLRRFNNMYPTASYFMRHEYRRELYAEMPEFYKNSPTGDTPIQLYLLSRGYGYYMNEIMSAYRRGAPDSWNSTRERSADAAKLYREARLGIIEMYRGFDEYTNHKYSEAVLDAIHHREFRNAEDIEDLSVIKSPVYIKSFKALPLSRKLRYNTMKYFPKIYYILRHIKHGKDKK